MLSLSKTFTFSCSGRVDEPLRYRSLDLWNLLALGELNIVKFPLVPISSGVLVISTEKVLPPGP